MTQKHTPGPWTAHGSNIQGPDGRDIGIASGPHTVGSSDVAVEERRLEYQRDHANARLIAASPLMLEALRETLGLFVVSPCHKDGYAVAEANIRALINAIEGDA